MIDIVYAASPEIAVKSLEALSKNPLFNVKAVLTQPDKPKGRGMKYSAPPVKTAAEKLGIKVLQTAKISADADMLKTLRELHPDFIVTFAFGQILSQEALDIPKYAVINLHASLLPAYRGANPIQRAVFNGDKETGITAMLTVLELDAGNICGVRKITIDENMTDIELSEVISAEAPELIMHALEGLYNGTITPVKQPEEGVTFAKKFKKEEGLTDWKKSAEQLHNQARAMASFQGAYTFYSGRMIKILKTQKTSAQVQNVPAGAVIKVSKSGIEVNTGKGSLLITEVKPENRGAMSAFSFANGAGIKAGCIFGE